MRWQRCASCCALGRWRAQARVDEASLAMRAAEAALPNAEVRITEHKLANPVNGDEYVGHVPVGHLTGTGIFHCKNGAVYSGQYEGNRMHGVGAQQWTDGDVYRGEFKRGRKDGIGVSHTFASGNRSFDRWESGQKISSVPFDAANPEHAAVLREARAAEARAAEARRFIASHRLGRNHSFGLVCRATC